MCTSELAQVYLTRQTEARPVQLSLYVDKALLLVKARGIPNVGWEMVGKSVSSLGYTLLLASLKNKQGSKGLLGGIEPCTCNSVHLGVNWCQKGQGSMIDKL